MFKGHSRSQYFRSKSSFYISSLENDIITELADLGISQAKIEWDGIIGRPDILRKGFDMTPDNFLISSLKIMQL
jgi:hypothetical protein